MTLPIDEMLLDLGEALRAFEDDPTDETFAAIQLETFRIESNCEDLLVEDEDKGES